MYALFINLRVQDNDLDRYTIILENVKERKVCASHLLQSFFFLPITDKTSKLYIYLFFLAVTKTYSNKECLRTSFSAAHGKLKPFTVIPPSTQTV